jgi:hypothetical protein
LGRSLAIGVLDAQQERAAETLGVEPVEQSRARAADMQEAGRRRREAGDDGGHKTGSDRILKGDQSEQQRLPDTAWEA